ncbi:hypothetical protein HDU79_011213 [Rhizoclosmatium sp. JEL0117]|nr:hypothetical protein HDU79_011213 [Rhizoclosmatium sp. JEL0117]
MTVGSFLGQLLFRPAWTADQLPDLSGQVAFVAGGCTGLGHSAAKHLALRGASVTVVAPDVASGESAVAALHSDSDQQSHGFVVASAVDLRSLSAAADEFLKTHSKLNILINADSISSHQFSLSEQGIEQTFHTNHFAPMLLTHKLLPLLEASQPSRIVNLTSMTHMIVLNSIDYQYFDVPEMFDENTRYNESKLASIHFTRELQDRLETKYALLNKPCNIYVNCVHPGAIKEDHPNDNRDLKHILLDSVKVNVEKGVITPLYAAAAPEIETMNIKGKYLVPYCTVAEPSLIAQDKETCVKTWQWSEYVFRHYFEPDFEMGI